LPPHYVGQDAVRIQVLPSISVKTECVGDSLPTTNHQILRRENPFLAVQLQCARQDFFRNRQVVSHLRLLTTVQKWPLLPRIVPARQWPSPEPLMLVLATAAPFHQKKCLRFPGRGY